MSLPTYFQAVVIKKSIRALHLFCALTIRALNIVRALGGSAAGNQQTANAGISK